jgi:polyphosphate:AMP phosphotransferase
VFDAAEVGNSVSKADYEARAPQLRVDLINAQYDLKQAAAFPVVVVLTGDDRGGVNETLNVLHEWMDARYLRTRAFRPPSDEERERPRFWRYWRVLPRKGNLALFVGDWSTSLIVDRLARQLSDAEWARGTEHAERLEQALVDDGALLLKFWIHLSKKEMKKRLERAKKDDGAALRVDELDRQIYENYDAVIPVAEELLRRTSSGAAPWQVIEGTDPHYRDLAVAEGILAALRGRLDGAPAQAAPPAPSVPTVDPDPHTTVLGSVDLSQTLPYDVYKERLFAQQMRLRKRARKARKKKLSAVIVLEGWDAAGKGGAIRRMTRALDARDYRVIPIAAPTEEEKSHHYLWRFWRHMPRDGEVLIFDRSWYGRVLVERVEGFAQPREWKRAYTEINDFEDQIVASGTTLVKFWLHLDPDEQLRRFEAREKTAFKKYKIGAEDYRNRRKWDAYVEAVDEMVARTSSSIAPWHLVPANDKRFARVTVLETVCAALEKHL